MRGMVTKHWSVNSDAFGANDTARSLWELENRINFGIGRNPISHTLLKLHWDTLDIDPWKRKALALALE